jgi:predicted acyltransferase (DUF342 family)
MKTVPARTRIRIDTLHDDLHLGPDATAEAQNSTVKVDGTVECEGNVHFKGNLTANSFRATKGKVTVNGSLKIADKIIIEEGSLDVSGPVEAESINIDDSLFIGKDLHADTVEVGGQVRIAGRTETRTINVGGILECKGRVHSDEVLVGNSVSIDEESTLARLDVGGSVKLAGGEVTSRLNVDGVLESTRPLNFATLDVGGSIVLTGSNKGGDLHIGVRGRVDGDLEFKTLYVSGRMNVTGTLRGGSADIGGRLEVGRAIELEDKLKVGTGIIVGGTLRSQSLEIAGTLEAGKAIVEETAKVGGMINTREGLRASSINTASNWEVRGPLAAERVELGSNSDVEDVYAHDLHMADGAKALNIYSARLQIGDNCIVAGVIEYTDYSKVGRGLTAEPGMPRKVRTLPSFPSIEKSGE